MNEDSEMLAFAGRSDPHEEKSAKLVPGAPAGYWKYFAHVGSWLANEVTSCTTRSGELLAFAGRHDPHENESAKPVPEVPAGYSEHHFHSES